MFNKKEKLSESLKTSGEILYAIEQVSGESFEHREFNGECADIKKNGALRLWEDAQEKEEVFKALPVENIENGEEVFWGDEGKFAEFDGKQWILTSFEYGIFFTNQAAFLTTDFGEPTARNIRRFATKEKARKYIDERLSDNPELLIFKSEIRKITL